MKKFQYNSTSDLKNAKKALSAVQTVHFCEEFYCENCPLGDYCDLLLQIDDELKKRRKKIGKI